MKKKKQARARRTRARRPTRTRSTTTWSSLSSEHGSRATAPTRARSVNFHTRLGRSAIRARVGKTTVRFFKTRGKKDPTGRAHFFRRTAAVARALLRRVARGETRQRAWIGTRERRFANLSLSLLEKGARISVLDRVCRFFRVFFSSSKFHVSTFSFPTWSKERESLVLKARWDFFRAR